MPTPDITRRGFVKAGGILCVWLGVPILSEGSEPAPTSLDPSRLGSWLEIHDGNRIVARTGRTETGTGMSAFYAQMIAEELNVRPEAITLIMGDTDQTPDGGYSAGFLSGAENVRKVAAYAFQALLRLASSELGVPITALTAAGGVVSGGGKSIDYGQLVQGRHLELTVPVSGAGAKMDPKEGIGVAGLEGFTVTGDPPRKPMSAYQVIGTSYPVPGIPDKVTGKTEWSCDVALPGMLHARMVRPAKLGSTLMSVGAIDKKRFPSAEVIAKGNLIAVVSPDEWEAATAARLVAAGTKWTEWSGLPGSQDLTRALRERTWGPPDASSGDAAQVTAALASAAKTVSATYELPYVRHAPIGPFVAVADARSDGSVTIWTHSANSQGLRARIANTLSVPAEKVVVRWLEHSGQYGRTTFGGDGAEADAAILSQIKCAPVRVQWTLEEDLAWSSVSPGGIYDIEAGLDANGHLVAVRNAFYSPHQSDARLLGAILAGMPAGSVKPGGWIALESRYDKIQNRLERVYAMPNLGSDRTSAGLRGNIMRTPAQRQQNFVLESMMNEAAAAVKADPIQFRLRHTTDQRLVDVLNTTAKAAGWEPRHSPRDGAAKIGTAPRLGRGMGVIVRSNGYWAGIAEILIDPSTGIIRVTKFTVGVECGKIINPRQLDRCVKGGVVMGLSEALKEEVTFDQGKVTSTDWSSYKILTMEETPEIEVVQISRDDQGFGTGGEAPNALGPPAIAAAFFDATGVQPRRLPLTPTRVLTLLKS